MFSQILDEMGTVTPFYKRVIEIMNEHPNFERYYRERLYLLPDPIAKQILDNPETEKVDLDIW